MSDRFKNCSIFIGRQMYNLNPSHKTFRLIIYSHLFFPPYSRAVSKIGREDKMQQVVSKYILPFMCKCADVQMCKWNY